MIKTIRGRRIPAVILMVLMSGFPVVLSADDLTNEPPAPVSMPRFGPYLDGNVYGVDWRSLAPGTSSALAVEGETAGIIWIDSRTGARTLPVDITGSGPESGKVLRTSVAGVGDDLVVAVHVRRGRDDWLVLSMFGGLLSELISTDAGIGLGERGSLEPRAPEARLEYPLRQLEAVFSWNIVVRDRSGGQVIEIVYSNGTPAGNAEIRVVELDPDLRMIDDRSVYRTKGVIRSVGGYRVSDHIRYYWKERGETDHAHLVIADFPTPDDDETRDTTLFVRHRIPIGIFDIVIEGSVFGTYIGDGYYSVSERGIIPIDIDGETLLFFQSVEFPRSIGPAGTALMAVDEDGNLLRFTDVIRGFHLFGLSGTCENGELNLFSVRDAQSTVSRLTVASVDVDVLGNPEEIVSKLVMRDASMNVRAMRFPVIVSAEDRTVFGYFQDEPGTGVLRFRYQTDEGSFLFEKGNLILDGTPLETASGLLFSLISAVCIALFQVVVGGAPALLCGRLLIAYAYRRFDESIRMVFPRMFYLVVALLAASVTTRFQLFSVMTVSVFEALPAAAVLGIVSYRYIAKRPTVPSERELFAAAVVVTAMFASLAAFDDAVRFISGGI